MQKNNTIFNCTLFFLWIFLYSCNQAETPNSKQKNSSPLSSTSNYTDSIIGKTEGSFSEINQFIPEGYQLLDSASGDLNLDEFPDIILVLHKKGEDSIHDSPPKRLFLIMIGQKDNLFSLVASNDNVVYNHTMGGVSNPEPFSGLEIKKGTFSVKHSGGMGSFQWEMISTFKYSVQEKNWLLFTDKKNSYNSNIKNSEETDIQTISDFGKVFFNEYDIYKNADQ